MALYRKTSSSTASNHLPTMTHRHKTQSTWSINFWARIKIIALRTVWMMISSKILDSMAKIEWIFKTIINLMTMINHRTTLLNWFIQRQISKIKVYLIPQRRATGRRTCSIWARLKPIPTLLRGDNVMNINCFRNQIIKSLKATISWIIHRRHSPKWAMQTLCNLDFNSRIIYQGSRICSLLEMSTRLLKIWVI